MTQWLAALSDWLAANPHWLGLALLLACFAECLAVVGLIVPGTLLVAALGVLAGSGVLGVSETLMLAFFGGLAGDLASYSLGRRYHQSIRRLPGLRSHPEWLLRAHIYFQRYGTASLLVGRFVGPLRPMLPLTAGMLDMPFPRFLLVSLIASAGWAMAYLLPPWAAGAALRLPLPEGFWHELTFILAALTVLLASSFYVSHRGLRLTSPLVAMLCALWLGALLLGWPTMAEFDQGLMRVVQSERTAPLDQLMIYLTRLGDFTPQLIAGLAVVFALLALRYWRAAIFAFVTPVAASLAVSLLKPAFARLRPDVLATPLDSYSLPSGHSSAAFAFFLVLGVLAGRGQPTRLRMTWMAMACVPATAVAISRVYLGVHWPTDILAGALLAASVSATTLALVQWKTPLAPVAPRHWALILPLGLGLLFGLGGWELAGAGEVYRHK